MGTKNFYQSEILKAFRLYSFKSALKFPKFITILNQTQKVITLRFKTNEKIQINKHIKVFHKFSFSPRGIYEYDVIDSLMYTVGYWQ